MRKIAMAAVFVGLFSGSAHAQGVATQNVNLTANVGGYCTIDGGPTGTVRSATCPRCQRRCDAGQSINRRG